MYNSLKMGIQNIGGSTMVKLKTKIPSFIACMFLGVTLEISTNIIT